jgi:hypothetical protein
VVSRALGAVIVAGLSAGGCHTAAGNWFANRGRDLGDCFRAEVGVAPAGGIDVAAAGLVHVGLGWGQERGGVAAGWAYGAGIESNPSRGSGDFHLFWHWPLSATNPQLEGWWPLALFGAGGLHVAINRGGRAESASSPSYVHRCWWLLPALTDLFDPFDDGAERWERLHAFDVEGLQPRRVARLPARLVRCRHRGGRSIVSSLRGRAGQVIVARRGPGLAGRGRLDARRRAQGDPSAGRRKWPHR